MNHNDMTLDTPCKIFVAVWAPCIGPSLPKPKLIYQFGVLRFFRTLRSQFMKRAALSFEHESFMAIFMDVISKFPRLKIAF